MNGVRDNPRAGTWGSSPGASAQPPAIVLAILLGIARCYVIFVGAAGFLLGSVFFNTFFVGALLAGLSGVAAAVSDWFATGRPRINRAVPVLCAGGLIGVALDAFRYYTQLDFPGNYYAWPMIGPFAAALVLLGWAARVRGR